MASDYTDSQHGLSSGVMLMHTTILPSNFSFLVRGTIHLCLVFYIVKRKSAGDCHVGMLLTYGEKFFLRLR